MIVSASVKGGRWSRRLVRLWGRTMLRVIGVRLAIEPACAAELALQRCRVMTFNHASTMDMFVMTALWPPGGVAIVKQEMMKIPVMGHAMRVLDFIPIDRSRRDESARSLGDVADRVRAGNLTVLVAPEGTRSPDGELQAFKLGPFHIAAKAQVPVVGIVIIGAARLWPLGQLHCNAGTVTIRVFPCEIPSTADVHTQASSLHASYEAILAAHRPS